MDTEQNIVNDPSKDNKSEIILSSETENSSMIDTVMDEGESSHPESPSPSSFIWSPDSNKSSSVQQLGGKAAALAKLSNSGLAVPSWFVITPEAFTSSLTYQQSSFEIGHNTTPSDMVEFIDSVNMSNDFIVALGNALNGLRTADEASVENMLVAVRSSAIDEDGNQYSFAGQLDSYLFVESSKVIDKIKQVWKSGFSQRVLEYRKQAGLEITLDVPAVLIQRMVNSDVSGVAFSVDPVSGKRDSCVIAAVWGLGSGLVSGELDADTYHVHKSGQLIQRTLAEKKFAHRINTDTDEGVSAQAVEADKINSATLDDELQRAVASLATQASDHFGVPQDIEWAIENKQLYLLQSRPITALKEIADPEGELNIWDNSNIVESYGGITTPLTFSFARKAYEEVYREFCKVLGVSKSKINDNDTTFKRMLGLIQGRVYYNLISWYRVLAMLPGYKLNRGFMEKMMGVREEMPEEILGIESRPGLWSRIGDGFRLASTAGGLVYNHFALNFKKDRFYKRLNKALDISDEQLTDMSADQLVAYYHELEQQLLTRWDAPLINDFFAMIFYGVLSKQTAGLTDDVNSSLHNDLISGEGGMVSAEPAQLVREMAILAMKHDGLAGMLANRSIKEIEQSLSKYGNVHKAIKRYLKKFGDRCLGELKLESETLHDNPLTLYRSIGHLAQRFIEEPELSVSHAGKKSEKHIRGAAEQKVQGFLHGKFFKRLMFDWVLKNARHRVRDRENLRFERTRLFGRVRRIFVEIGKRLQQSGVLMNKRDIFWLEVHEILGYIEGTSSTATASSLQSLVEMRYKEFSKYEEMEAPADRFETRGIVNWGNDFKSNTTGVLTDGTNALDESDPNIRKGIACCAGIVTGKVRVVTDPRHAEMRAGEILVAEQTDPGWIMLFSAASGILVERGSLLSHSAIVSREMGIPSIVSIPGITKWLNTGDEVELNGTTGVVRKI
ncbi:Pyruvate-utilizing enzyme, similar to phosphoenolpyruvate synthase [hydrothermal vent metagenome]|uniref:Pyruvate-utilizing enzyme, similar to phosphoenolpyruvate synthase n=1 Tax=hydrothermal vent metagenome TaxID=652676 RepID=A0A3B0YN62_9ZZZZ